MKDNYYENLLINNKAWAEEMIANDKDYFIKLSKAQTPPLLWIGCSDSRVPANVITGTLSGEIFVHRNIANMVVHTDMNMLSVLDYAVNHLKVKHVVVCGHYGCGGVEAAMSNKSLGLINKWIRNIKEVYRENYTELNKIKDDKKRFDRLVELNVKVVIFEPNINAKEFMGCVIETNLSKFKKLSDIIVTNRLDKSLKDVEDKTYTRDLFHDN